MTRPHLIRIGLILSLLLPLLNACNKSKDKQQATDDAASASSAAVPTSPVERTIIGRWQLDRNASVAAKLGTAKMAGGIGYEFKADGTGLRRVGSTPADPITWKTVTTSGDSIKLTVIEERASGNPTAVEITPIGPNQLRVTDLVGSSILERTESDISAPQPDYAPTLPSMSPVGSIDIDGTGIKLAASKDGASLIERTGMALRKNFVRWDMTTRKPVFAIDLAGGIVLPVAMSGDGRLCVTGDANGATLWNARTGEKLRAFAPRPGQGGTPVALLLNSDCSLLVMAAGKYLIAWEADSGEERFSIKADETEITAAVMTPNGKKIVTGGKDNLLKVWNVSDGKLYRKLDPGEKSCATALAISSDGNRLAAAHLLGKIAVFDFAAGLMLRSIDPHHPRIEHMVFMPDDKTLVHPVHSSTWDLALTDTDTGEARELLKGHTQSITSLALTSDGDTLYSASDDQTIKIWDLKPVNR